ncbi:BrnT family toxin [Hydrogenovibrio halophilus]|uniref:BrnT family toxin n=1 Tax=Hydrogenovibrio halophilus TaxID=373391 RepID=UPI00036B02B7|nr:BrnT family toxin [Hydrogenovibrio halophilus]
MVIFEWDESKSDANMKKHSVSFEEAKTVFYDEFATLFEDEYAKGEERFILLGKSNLSRLLVVVHCERGPDSDVLRIISARKATPNEQRYYRRNLK